VPAPAPSGPQTSLTIRWDGGSRLIGSAGGHEQLSDWDGKEALSPVQTLALALAGCMASDVVTILQKGRLPLRALTAELRAERAASEPRRFLSIELRFEVVGDVPADRVERAIALSREKYCSVWHSMRQDIAFTTSFAMKAERA